MRFPRGRIHIPGMDNKSHALKLLRNLYGGKAASRIWVRYPSTGIRNIGFKPSKVDECVWYRGDIIFTFYVDDGRIIKNTGSTKRFNKTNQISILLVIRSLYRDSVVGTYGAVESQNIVFKSSKTQ